MTQKGTKIDGDRRLLRFRSYEEYLDSLVGTVDLCYLRSTTVARAIAELGYRCAGETLLREEFHRRLEAVRNLLHPVRGPYELASELAAPGRRFQQELALRERANRIGAIATIVFLRNFTKSGFEISGYIDFAHRLTNEDWTPFFHGKKRLRLRPSDLAFYHWRLGKTVCNETQNFQPVIDPRRGLEFKCLKDRCVVSIDPGRISPGISTTRVNLRSEDYEQVVFFDHVLRRKL